MPREYSMLQLVALISQAVTNMPVSLAETHSQSSELSIERGISSKSTLKQQLDTSVMLSFVQDLLL